MRRPTKLNSFEIIRRIGIPIETVIDVGVLKGTYELFSAFKDKKQLLIEPIVEWNESIRQAYTKGGIDFLLVNAAASNEDGLANLKLSTVIPGKPITHAQLTKNTSGPDIRTVPARRVDSLVKEASLPGPYLLKIDVDGAEILVLEGSRHILENCNIVVIEAKMNNYIERSQWLENEGFGLFDIVDICYYEDRLRQVDLVFVRAEILRSLDLGMNKAGFDFSKWHEFA